MIPNNSWFSKLEAYALPAIVVLVGVGAFGLGRLSVEPHKTPLRVLYPGATVVEPLENLAAIAEAASFPDDARGVGNVVASKNGTKYYLTTCSGANRIKQENRVYFDSIEAARAAGYEPAANCPGL